MQRFRLFLLSILLFLASEHTCLAGNLDSADFYARMWTTDEGLPHNIVSHLIQDRTGYMWLATSGGLTRFDGHEFKTISLPPELREKGYNIRGLAELPDASLLLLLPDGNIAQLHNGKLSVHPVTTALAGKTPTDLFVESSGVIWVGTEEGELFRWQEGVTASFGKADGIERRAPVFSFAVDRHGRTWVASGRFLGHFENGSLVPFPRSLGTKLLITASRSGGLWILADARLLELDAELHLVPHSAPGLPAYALPRQIFEDRDHGVWIATRRQGLFRLTNDNLDHVPFSSDFVLAITDDHEGNIWVGTEGAGVGLLRRRLCTVLNTADGLPPFTDAVCADLAGGVWFAARSSGVHHYSNGRCKPVPGADGLVASTISRDKTGTLWIGTTSGLYRLARDTNQPRVKIDGAARGIRTLFCAHNGDVWFATVQGTLGRVRDDQAHLFSTEEGYGNERITSITEDPSGTIWLGSVTGSLYRFSQGQLGVISLPANIPVSPIHALHCDEAGRLWIGTADGLLLYTEGHVRRFTTADGMLDALILQINEDDSGHFWFGSRHGLFRVARDQLLAVAAGSLARVETIRIGKDDGVPSLTFPVGGQPLSARDTRGRLWFVALQGAVVLDPVQLSASLPLLHVVLQETRLDGHAQEAGPALRFPSGKHRIEFQFAVLSYAALEKIKVQHQLEGIDPDWVDTEASRIASYSSLPPGDYSLRFKAHTDENNARENESLLKFSVVPAWWQTPWARSGAIICALAVAFGVFRRYTHWQLKLQLEKLQREHALEKERARISRDIHDELGGSLTRIAFGVDQLKRRFSSPESGALLEQLSQRVRRHASDLQRVVWVESPKNDSLDRVCFFISRFAHDYFRDSSVSCVVRSPTDIPTDPIPPDVQHHLIAIAKEAFNNVLKHSRATQVTVDARFQAAVFSLTIADNGVGFEPAVETDSDHNGLTNMRTRIAEINGTVDIRSQPGTGAIITITWMRRKNPAPARQATG